METMHRLTRPLVLLGFSLIILIALTSCDKEYMEAYTFRNELNENVYITVYSINDKLNSINGKPIEIGVMEQVKLLEIISDSQRNALGANYFSQLVDSVSVRFACTEKQIVFWRKGGEHYYDANFTHLRDIFSPNEAPWRFKSIGSYNVEYYYLLNID